MDLNENFRILEAITGPKIIDDGKYSNIQKVCDETASSAASTSQKTYKTKLPTGVKEIYITCQGDFLWVTRNDKEKELETFNEGLQQVVENSQVRLKIHFYRLTLFISLIGFNF